MRLALALSLTAHSAVLGGLAYQHAPSPEPLRAVAEVQWLKTPRSKGSDVTKNPRTIATDNAHLSTRPLPAPTLDRVHAFLEYPAHLRRKRVQGQVQLLARLDAAGELVALTLESSSQTPELDVIALDAVRRAAPFPELAPAHTVRIPIAFRLASQ